MPARPLPADVAALVLRVGLGTTFVLVGWVHTFEGRGVIVDALAFLPAAEEVALAISVAEVVAGSLLLLGALVPLAVLVTVTVNAGAIVVYLAGPRGTFLYADVAMLGAAVALLAFGPGRWSVASLLQPALPQFPGPADAWGRAALRLGLAATLLAGAVLAFQPGIDGYEVIDARLPSAGAPVAALVGACAGTLALLGLAPRAAAALTALLGALALIAFGFLGGFVGYVVFFFPTLASATALAAIGTGGGTLPAWLARRGPRATRDDPAPLAWALAAMVVVGAIAAGAAQAPATVPPGRVLPTTRLVELGVGQAQLGEGDAWIGEVPVRGLVLREVVATLTWTDDQPGSGPDEFTLELVPPPGLDAGPAAEGAGGRLELRVPVYRTPPPGDPQLGVGGWHLRVYLRGAGDGATLGIAPGMPDEGNDFHLVVTGTAFQR